MLSQIGHGDLGAAYFLNNCEVVIKSELFADVFEVAVQLNE